MEILKFRTNIKTEDDVKKVAELLDQETSIHLWKLDPDSSGHILNASGQELDPQLVKNLLGQAGYEAEFIQVFGAGGGGI